MPQHQRRDDEDVPPLTAVQAAYRFANDHGPVALIAVASIGFMAYLWVTTLSAMSNDIRDHRRESGWYMHQMCVSMAVSAGTPQSLCDPPREDHR